MHRLPVLRSEMIALSETARLEVFDNTSQRQAGNLPCTPGGVPPPSDRCPIPPTGAAAPDLRRMN